MYQTTKAHIDIYSQTCGVELCPKGTGAALIATVALEMDSVGAARTAVGARTAAEAGLWICLSTQETGIVKFTFQEQITIQISSFILMQHFLTCVGK